MGDKVFTMGDTANRKDAGAIAQSLVTSPVKLQRSESFRVDYFDRLQAIPKKHPVKESYVKSITPDFVLGNFR